MDDMQIWALATAPWDPDLILAGTQPAGLFRSTDGGRSWAAAEGAFAQECIFVHKPRVTQILFDPEVRGRVRCGIEIDGIHRSDDGGARSEERRVGQECVRPCRSRWSQQHSKKKKNKEYDE